MMHPSALLCAAAILIAPCRVHAQSTGTRLRTTRIAGGQQTTEIDQGKTGGRWLHTEIDSAGLGSGAGAGQKERHGFYAACVPGGVFLRVVAEHAAGGPVPGNADWRVLISGSAAVEDIFTVDAGAALAGQSGFINVPLHVWHKAVTPPLTVLGDAPIPWIYVVNATALTGDPVAGSENWRDSQSYSVTNYLLFGTELPLPEGTDFSAGPIMLRVPLVFGEPQLFTIAGGVSAMAPLSRAAVGADPGSVARLTLTARLVPGAPVSVETEAGVTLAAGTWSAWFSSAHDYTRLPELPPLRVFAPQSGEPGRVDYDGAPGVEYLLESGDGSAPWMPQGIYSPGDGHTLSTPWVPGDAGTGFFRLRYRLVP